ncbi:hypothetical protein AOQ84DRAFT_148268 [Glonium stellatum]|uniref:Uncharacterized protein n=1 Tax=Glonium stellatum TaxID=574774 RepID=A0A8E2F9Y1_9PEZI|nr:hypothetical protein AOQ84DRAFT_148268 [Glonium stellatum]
MKKLACDLGRYTSVFRGLSKQRRSFLRCLWVRWACSAVLNISSSSPLTYTGPVSCRDIISVVTPRELKSGYVRTGFFNRFHLHVSPNIYQKYFHVQ